MKKFKVVENRGCGISYPQFFGALEECQKWIEDNCEPSPLNPNINWMKEDGEWLANGDGNPFDYYIEEDKD